MRRKTTMNKRLFLVINIVFVLMAVLVTAFPTSAFADSKKEDKKVIRVGYVESPGFSEGASKDKRKSGYSYEYLQKIANITGWEYEYVYDDWTDLIQMLKNGEIDVMAGLSYSEESSEDIDFPDHPMGYENYYIYAYDNQPFVTGDFDRIKGAKIGCKKESMQQKFLEEWNLDNEYNCKIELYNDNEDMYEAFDCYEIAAVVDTDNALFTSERMTPLINIGKSDYYLAVAKGRTEILDELNDCLAKLNLSEPYLTQNLHAKYFSKLAAKMMLSEREENWLKENKVIRIGYEKNFLAFCGEDEKTKELKGALKTFIDEMKINFRQYNFKVETVSYDTVGDALDALERGEIDTVFPVYQSLYDAEAENLNLSEPIVSSSMTALTGDRKFDEFSNNKVAVTKGFLDVEWYIKEKYPNWKIKTYDTFEDCIAAIKKNEVDCTVESVYVYKTLVDYRTVNAVALSKHGDVSFAVRKSDKELLSILNRAIAVNSENAFVATLTEYAGGENKTTIIEVVRDNILVIGGVGVAIVVVMFLLTIAATKSKKKAELAEKSAELARIEAEESNLAKTTFLNNMSHDIRTPMNAILGYANLIAKEKDSPEAVANYVKKIENSGDYLITIINNVLDMAKIESGKAVLDLNSIDLLEQEEFTIDIFDEKIKKKNLTFNHSFKIAHQYVYVDMTKLRQIQINLLSNAIKYTPEGGEISVDVREVSAEEGYATFVATVSDNGIGMSQEYLEHIFDAFSRERNTTESKIIGTGLGMAIVKNLVELMDGKIEVASELGKGTIFTVTLSHKIAEKPETYIKEQLDKKNKTCGMKGKRILLAEDNDLNAEIATTVLEDAGFLVDWAEDGVVCIDMLNKADDNYYDLILMDIQMPNLNGYLATNKIRNMDNAKKASIPIVALTANAFEEDRRRALAEGMNGHIAKPIDVSKLIDEISSLL